MKLLFTVIMTTFVWIRKQKKTDSLSFYRLVLCRMNVINVIRNTTCVLHTSCSTVVFESWYRISFLIQEFELFISAANSLYSSDEKFSVVLSLHILLHTSNNNFILSACLHAWRRNESLSEFSWKFFVRIFYFKSRFSLFEVLDIYEK